MTFTSPPAVHFVPEHAVSLYVPAAVAAGTVSLPVTVTFLRAPSALTFSVPSLTDDSLIVSWPALAFLADELVTRTLTASESPAVTDAGPVGFATFIAASALVAATSAASTPTATPRIASLPVIGLLTVSECRKEHHGRAPRTHQRNP